MLVFAFCAGMVGIAFSQDTNTESDENTGINQQDDDDVATEAGESVEGIIDEGQELLMNDVPNEVRSSFKTDFSTANNATWSKEGDDYVVNFKGAGNKDMHVVYNAGGIQREKYVSVTQAGAPEKIKTFVSSNYPDYTIQNIWKNQESSSSDKFYKVKIVNNEYIGTSKTQMEGSDNSVGTGAAGTSGSEGQSSSTGGTDATGSTDSQTGTSSTTQDQDQTGATGQSTDSDVSASDAQSGAGSETSVESGTGSEDNTSITDQTGSGNSGTNATGNTGTAGSTTNYKNNEMASANKNVMVLFFDMDGNYVKSSDSKSK